jgi:hypothetical protein
MYSIAHYLEQRVVAFTLMVPHTNGIPVLGAGSGELEWAQSWFALQMASDPRCLSEGPLVCVHSHCVVFQVPYSSFCHQHAL